MSFGFRYWPLRWKMFALLLTASALPLSVAALIAFFNAREAIDRDTVALLSARAEQVAGEVDEFNGAMLQAATRLANSPLTQRFFSLPPEWRGAGVADVLPELNVLPATDPRLRGVALVDPNGDVIASTEPSLEHRSLLRRRTVRLALQQGSSSVSDLYISLPEVGSMPSLSFAVPVRSADGKTLGAALVFARASALWELVRAENGKAGEGSFSVVYDEYGIRIAHSSNDLELFRPGQALGPEVIEQMVEEGRFGAQTRELLTHPSLARAEFEHSRPGAIMQPFRTFSPANRQDNLVVGRRLASAPWTLFYLVPGTTVEAPVRQLLQDTALASIVLILLAVGIGLVFADRILAPVRALTRAANEQRAGNAGVRAHLEPGDELGQLGASFDLMAEALAQRRDQLEAQVRERTEELKLQNRALETRTEELTARQARDVAFGQSLAALAGGGELRTMLDRALRVASDYLHALVMVVYRIESGSLVPVGQVGTGDGLTPLPLPTAGHLAEALRSSRPVTLELPADSNFRFNAGLVQGKPRELTLLRVTVNDRNVGLLAAGSVQPFPPSAIAFLHELSVPLGLAIARVSLLEETKRQNQELGRSNNKLREQAAELSEQARRLLDQQLALEAKSREVQRADQAKSEFLANMSHELRTPLNAVIGFSELLLEDRALLAEQHIQFVVDILHSGRHLLALINAVLDLAKIEAGRVPLQIETLDPAAELASACSLVAPLAQKRGQRIVQAVHATQRVRADRQQLQQILLNLLANAIKFSPDRSEIVAEVEDLDTQLLFSVRDQGPGIEAQLLARLFEPFAQGDGLINQQQDGTGLGLAITRRLVQQNGGSIDVQTKVGQGSTFRFKLPGERASHGPGASAREAASGQAPGPLVSGRAEVIEEAVLESIERAQPRQAGATQAGESTMLVVDDHATNRELARTLLERRGYRVLLAENGREGLRLARLSHPQVIFLDLAMPVMDGFEAARELRGDPLTQDIKLIAFTALAMRGDEERALRAGFDGYLAKPIDRATLDEVMARVLEKPSLAAP